MNYKKVYDALIRKRIDIPLKKLNITDDNYLYTERHHIIPRSMGGTDDESNLILLTVEEHFVAHDLLYHYYRENGDVKGANGMLRALTRLLNSYDGKSIENTYANRLHAFQLRK